MKNEVDYDLLNKSYKELVDIVGMENMLKIRDNFGGIQLQLPMRLYDPQAIKIKIKDKNLTAKEVRELSIKYGLSPRWFKQYGK
ncbi:hypothetical protein [Companilactobacillus nuruki]|uniref:Mor transcription activator domain-containing protein n=1 Tax=Companilactobacillus nuruki TaxID=1993540 RepID=A0A2N7ASZ2_9LACO|nr:hypothetical protein [Companilactobacillus nuruki]PMD68809.1 hypothetical protein CBP76_08905 [Companilactobacillus nuruki]